MKQGTRGKREPSTVVFDRLEALAREQIEGWLQGMLEAEVTEFLGRLRSERQDDAVDATRGYRNGFGKERKVATTMGTLRVRRPRVRDTDEKFESRLLPYFVKRTKEMGTLLPELYLHGLAQGDFEMALRGLLGAGAPLSKASIDRLKSVWQSEYDAWKGRSLGEREAVYVWADGIYVKAGLEKDKAALLVMVAAMRDGRKEVLAVVPGHRESEEAWKDLLRDLKRRGLKAPRLVLADGHLGIWGALSEVWPEAEQQRCWNHKIRNVVDKLPKREQPAASKLLKAMPYAATKKEAQKLRDQFVSRYQTEHPKATKCLLDDWDRMVAFYQFPKVHWKHLRTTNIVESPFAAVRLRTDAAKRFKKVPNATALMWKLLLVAEKNFRLLDGAELLRDVHAGRTYIDGELVVAEADIKNAA